jgi:hypothetical protein
VNPRWRWLCLLACVACSRKGEIPRAPETIPQGTAADSTDISPDESAPVQWTASLDSAEITTGSLSLSVDALPDSGGEQPRVVVRCEGGRLGAYLVTSGTRDGDSTGLADRAVPVTIDSAPPC